MDVVKLTNLGNLTLENLLRIDQRYDTKAEIKRKKLSKLWDSKDEMDEFVQIFSAYKQGDLYLVYDGNKSFTINSRNNSEKSIDSKIIERALNFDLVEIESMSDGPDKIIKKILSSRMDNPIKRLSNLSYEITGLCNCHCNHCYKEGSDGEIGIPVNTAKRAMEILIRAGIGSINITGGEPTIRKNDVLEVVDHASNFLLIKDNLSNKRVPDKISIVTNGYFNGHKEFIDKIKQYGDIMLKISLDSYNGHLHNKNRRKKGSFGKVKNLVKVASELGFKPYIYSSNLGGCVTRREKENKDFFSEYAITFEFEGFHVIGSAALKGFNTIKSQYVNKTFGSLDPKFSNRTGWCTGWTRPVDIHIKSNGNVGNCLMSYSLPQEFGNLYHQEMGYILNNIQNTRIFQMSNDGTIERNQHEIDKTLYPMEFNSSCEPFIITLTYSLLKEKYKIEGIKDFKKKANIDTAKSLGYLK